MASFRGKFAACIGAALWGLISCQVTSPGSDAVGFDGTEDPLYVGSYRYVTVKIDPNAGILFDDIDFYVPAGPDAGIVSAAREKSFDPTIPTVLLGAGWRPGIYTLSARLANGSALGETSFEVTPKWNNPIEGPSQWFQGRAMEPVLGAAWGGGPAGAQNANVLGSVTGPWRVAILLVDARGAASPFVSDSGRTAQMRSTYSNAVFNVANQYYQEVSYGAMSLPGSAADVGGPYSLPGDWSDYYYIFPPAGVWAPRDELIQAAIQEADSSFDFSQYDTVLVVGSGGSGGGQAPWPFAWGGVYTSNDGTVNLRTISMPAATTWGSLQPVPIDQIVIHEIGHNLGMWDLYFPDNGRRPSRLDAMDTARDYKHLSAMHRLMLGWLPSADVFPLDVGSSGSAVDQTVVLSPINEPALPGTQSAVEVRVSDGHNYYFEYRRKSSGAFGDDDFDGEGMVIMTDTISYPRLATTLPDPVGSNETPPSASPIQRMPTDPDGDPVPASFLRIGDDYEEFDISDPTAPAFFRAETVDIDASQPSATLRFTWDKATPLTNGSARPDPSIREWPSPTNQWQSPDIEVRNDRNWDFATDVPTGPVSLRNVPWEGQVNTVVAKVRNETPVFADNVEVRFYIKDFSISGAPLSFLGSDVQDVPGGASGVEFKTTWNPAIALVGGAEVHYCIVANIVPWRSDDLQESDPTNNHAQSNYTRMISSSASPHTREMTLVLVSNPYDYETLALLRASQSNPLYRAFVQYKWLVLEPRESRKVRVMSEFVGGDVPLEDEKAELYAQYRHSPNDLEVRGILLSASPKNPASIEPMQARLLGGVGIVVTEGKATKFEKFNVEQIGRRMRVTGRVTIASGESDVGEGTVILITKTEKSPWQYHRVPLDKGEFQYFLRAIDWRSIQGYYVPSEEGFDEVYSEVVPNRWR